MATTPIRGGWVVVGAVFAMLAVAAGLGFYNMTVYLRALVDERGFSVGQVSGATGAFFLVGGIAGIPVASFIARHDVRLTIAGGALLGGGSLALLGQVSELWQLYVLYAVFALGFSAAGLVPGTTVVTRWFAERRSVALSVASTGLSVGGILVTPLSARLIGRHGLTDVSPWLGLAFAVGILAVTPLVRPWPRTLAHEDHASVGMQGTSFRDAVRSRFFVGVTIAYVLVMLAQVGGISHLFNLVSERIDEDRAAAAVSALALSSVVGRLLGASGYGNFDPTSDSRPFELSVGGEAYQVLEVLVGDVACLLDAVMSDASQHPGFVVHDCPREADMSERLYREFLLMMAEAAARHEGDAPAPFQYIVTTTSPPPEQLRSAQHVALELRPGSDENLLFKRRLVPRLPGF